MSSFDFGDRTLPPTERRRREARNQGEVARSAQLTSAVALLAASGLFWMTTPLALDPINAFLRKGLTTIPLTSLSIDSTTEMIRTAGAVFASIVFPLGLLLVISGLVANVTQVGWLWVPSAVAPRLRGRAWNFGHSLSEATGLILRAAVLGCVTWRFLRLHEWPLYSLSLNEPALMLTQLVRIVAEFCLQLSACLVLLGLVDYGYRFWRHEQSLKMTVEELRREQRDDSNDPQLRNRRSRAIHQAGRPVALSEIEPVAISRGS